jgi:hypothetical protein
MIFAEQLNVNLKMNKHTEFADSNIWISINPGVEFLDNTPKDLSGSFTEVMIIRQFSSLEH